MGEDFYHIRDGLDQREIMKRLKNYYVRPQYITLDGATYWKGYKTYSEYNYLKPGIVSWIKTRHFETALKLTSKYFHKCNVIDFGCADGAFLPSLAKYFNHVVAVDRKPDFMRIASKLVGETGINNVELICNDNLTIKEVKSKISSEEWHILYLLDILEHVGDRLNMYGSKVEFLREVSTLIHDDGIIVISVPKMIGISFLIQRLGLTLLRMNQESISIRDLIKAGIFNDTSNLEKKWNGGHLGFNHKRLENYIRKEFSVLEKKNDLFHVIYVIGK